MISATNLAMRFGSKILFKDVNFQLNNGNHYGLVGANGSGKSTLIKMIAGEITPEKGDIGVPSQTTVGSLKQDHFIYDEVPILDTVLMGKPALWKALQAHQSLLQKECFTEQECDELASLEKIISHHAGYAAPSEAAKLLEGLGLPAGQHHHPLRMLSGGYKLRVLLAQLLFSGPGALLLDEPTNHLDIFSIRWLEGYLKQFPGILLVSSHDRHFLNAVCDHIVDVDHQTLKIYHGDYDAFEESKLWERAQKEAALGKHERKKEHIQTFVDRFKAKATKARQAQSKMRLIEKLEQEMSAIDLSPSMRRYPHINFEQCRPTGAKALTLKGISKSYGLKQVLKNVSFEVERGDRIAFIGPNGIGKSTLLEILAQSIPSCSGTFEWGHAARLAYFPQDHQRYVNGAHTLLTWLGQFDPLTPEEKLRGILGTVLFTGDDVHKPVKVLSGGETARLLLARMILIKHNIMIFDEPTNHLDMEATESLIEALEEYPGTILFVSHNRYFVSRIAKRIIEMTPSGIRDFRCTYQEYLEQNEIDHLCAKSSLKNSSDTKAAEDTGRTTYEQQKQRQRQRAQLEKKAASAEEKCHMLENMIKDIDHLLAGEGFYQRTPKAELDTVLAKKASLENELSAALEAWERASIELME